MFSKNRNKKVGLYVMVGTSCLVLAVLATPETALAKKPGGGGGGPEALHGSATFRDAPGDRVRSDGEGPYTYTGSGKGDAILLGLGDFFRLSVKVDKKGVGRRFDLDFLDSEGSLIVDPAFLPENPYAWKLYVGGTLEAFRNVPIDDVGVTMVGRLRFGTKGADFAYVNYGAAPTWDGTKLTVKRIDTDVWTIESKPGDQAHLFRENGEVFGYASMPFLITYYGQGMP
ncbi:MAG: hypothetical protein ACYTEK_11810 [Planctomycetota bacterium]|jgi:hypothetical protein